MGDVLLQLRRQLVFLFQLAGQIIPVFFSGSQLSFEVPDILDPRRDLLFRLGRLAASIFHRDIHSIGAVKADMAAAGVPVRLVEDAA